VVDWGDGGDVSATGIPSSSGRSIGFVDATDCGDGGTAGAGLGCSNIRLVKHDRQ
jgi:hypothetical protein